LFSRQHWQDVTEPSGFSTVARFQQGFPSESKKKFCKNSKNSAFYEKPIVITVYKLNLLIRHIDTRFFKSLKIFENGVISTKFRQKNFTAGFRPLLSKNGGRTAANFSRPNNFFWGRF